eukprot:1158741-Pelagomonas_calceolata.AAC.5
MAEVLYLIDCWSLVHHSSNFCARTLACKLTQIGAMNDLTHQPLYCLPFECLKVAYAPPPTDAKKLSKPTASYHMLGAHA